MLSIHMTAERINTYIRNILLTMIFLINAFNEVIYTLCYIIHANVNHTCKSYLLIHKWKQIVTPTFHFLIND